MLAYRKKKKKKADTCLEKLADQIRTKEKLKDPGTCGVGRKISGEERKGGVSRRLSRMNVLTV